MRLTNTVKEKIIEAVCAAVTEQRVKDCARHLEDIERCMACEVEDKVCRDLGICNFNTLRRFESLVAQRSSFIIVMVTHGDSFKIKIPADVFIPTKEWQYVVNSDDYEAFPDLIASRLSAIEGLRQAKDAQTELANETRKVVYSVNSVKQLLERWPDVVKYYSLDAKGANLPACVDASQLNNLITTLQQQ